MSYVFLIGDISNSEIKRIQESVEPQFTLRHLPDLTQAKQYRSDLVIALLLATNLCENRLKDCLREVRADFPGCPVIMLGGPENDEQLIVDSIKAGAVDFISLRRIPELPQVIQNALKSAFTNRRGLNVDSLLVLEDLTDVILIIDGEEGHIVYANPMIDYILGYQDRDIIGQSFRSLIPIRWPSIDIIQEVRTNGSVFESLEFVHASGRIVLMDLIATMIEWDGQIAVLAMLRDVTEREYARAALREMEHRLRMVIVNAPVMLMVLTPSGEITLAEGQLLETLDFDTSTMIGQSAFSFFHEYAEIVEDLRYVLGGASTSKEYSLRGRFIEFTFSPLKPDDTHLGVICVGIDRTERETARLAEQSTRRMANQIGQEQKRLTFQKQFVSLVAHQFRTPLAVIASSSNNLRAYYDRLDESRRQKHFDNVFDQVSLLSEMIDDMLVYVERQSGYLEYSAQLFNVENLIRDVLHEMHGSQRNNLIVVRSGNLKECYLDGKLLRLIVTNLIGNAIKYTHQDQLILVVVEAYEGVLYVTVADRGIGIPQSQQETIFEPFKRARNALDFRGTGLGLAIVRMAVDAHGGVIALVSKESVGTCFTVRLPISR